VQVIYSEVFGVSTNIYADADSMYNIATLTRARIATNIYIVIDEISEAI